MTQIREEIRSAVDYRAIIRKEFDKRRQNNPKYSLRAFARDFKVSPSFLSEVLSEKARFSKEQGLHWATMNRLTASEIVFFGELVDLCDGRTDAIRNAAKMRLNRLRVDSDVEKLRIDSFRLISDWHHFAIIEALKLPDAEHTPDWLAAHFGVSKGIVTDSLRRLERLKFLERAADGRYTILKPRSITGGVPSEFIRHFHASILEKATAAIFSQPVDARDLSATIIAFDSALMPKYRELIDEFRKKVIDLANSSPTKDVVYSLSLIHI